jgi:hypothetical protein
MALLSGIIAGPYRFFFKRTEYRSLGEKRNHAANPPVKISVEIRDACLTQSGSGCIAEDLREEHRRISAITNEGQFFTKLKF